MSTIGHFDFFGTYLVMILPLCGASFIFSQRRIWRCIGLAAVMAVSLGAAASRTDSALIGVQLGCAALLMLSGDSYNRMARALVVWAIGLSALLAVNILFRYGTLGVDFSGPHAFVCDRSIALAAAALLILGALFCLALDRRQVSVPGKKKMVLIIGGCLAAALLIVLGAIFYFTIIDPRAELGKAGRFLRFDDKWGSYRGFVYTRALDAYAAYTPIEMLFGKGIDTTRSILSAYADHPVIAVVGVFDDAHNQILQLLITGGLLCAGTFTALYAVMLITLFRSADNDPVLCGAAASVFAYLVILLINVTQPILISTYFSICAIALSRIQALKRRRNAE